MALVARQRFGLTAKEYFAQVERLPPHAQLIDGEVIVNSPSFAHQDLVGELYLRLRLWIAEAPGRGWCGIPLDVQVDGTNVYEPDVWWCRESRRPRPDVARLPALPDLAVEVLSPSTRRHDLGVKRDRYEQHGLPELWIVDPRDRAQVPVRILRRSTPGASTFDIDDVLGIGDVIRSPQLPGFALGVADLLARAVDPDG